MEDKPTYTTDSQPDPPRDLPPWAISLAREIVRQAAAPGRYTIHLQRDRRHVSPHITIAKVERLRDWTP
jgi:pyridoxine 5'-phosphate synthase PdxJ